MKKFTKADLYLFGTLCLLALLACLWIFGIPGKKTDQIEVLVDGKTYGIYPLYEDQQIPIVLDHKTENVVVICDGEAYMESATCPDKLCKKQGHICYEGQQIVCLPNKVVVRVLSEKEVDFDAIAQ